MFVYFLRWPPLSQAIHIGKHEYINAFGTDDWRKSIRNSVNGNYNHRFPPTPEQHVVAGLQTGTPPPQPASCPPSNLPAESPQPRPTSPPPQPAVIPNPVATLANGGEGSASSPAPAVAPAVPAAPIALATPATPSNPVCHPERSAHFASRTVLRDEGSQPIPAAPAAQPTTPPLTPPPTPNRNPSPFHFDHNYRLRIDGKPF